MTDHDSSAPKKPGFLRRLFGGGTTPEPAPEAPAAADAAEPPRAPDEQAGAAELAWDTAPFAGPASPESAESPAPPERATEAAATEAPDLDAPAAVDDIADDAPTPAVPTTGEAARPSWWSRLSGAPEPVAAPAPPADEDLADEDLANEDLADEDLVDEDLSDTPAAIEAAPDVPAARPSWWSRLKQGMARSSSSIGGGITDVFTKRKLDAGTLEDLDDILIRADLGVATAGRITDAIGKGRFDKTVDPEEVKAVLAREVERVLEPLAVPLAIDRTKKPFTILMIGVNGSGKTTTIGKLAAKFAAGGHAVMLAAGDTFRAAAVEQLKVWGARTGAPVVVRGQGADAAGLAFDAVKQAREAGSDVLLIDTAGRLQNRTELMDELAKIIRVLRKVDAEAPHAVLLVLDATVGQNAMSQVEIFGQVAGVTGLVMTKLDGTARGGILVAIADRFQLPIHFIGVGEGVDDLEPFAARDFARAIAGLEDA